MTELETERLILRPWRDADLPPFAEMNADPRVMEHFLSTIPPQESDAFVARIGAHFDEHGYGFFAVEERRSCCFIGFVGLAHVAFDAHFTPAVEIGWRLAHTAWGQGYATEGARACLRAAFEGLALDEVVSFTVEANGRSRAVMERVGLRHDPADDFDHPKIPSEHPICRHVLYRARSSDWLASER